MQLTLDSVKRIQRKLQEILPGSPFHIGARLHVRLVSVPSPWPPSHPMPMLGRWPAFQSLKWVGSCLYWFVPYIYISYIIIYLGNLYFPQIVAGASINIKNRKIYQTLFECMSSASYHLISICCMSTWKKYAFVKSNKEVCSLNRLIEAFH